jgi:hypothetical protein
VTVRVHGSLAGVPWRHSLAIPVAVIPQRSPAERLEELLRPLRYEPLGAEEPEHRRYFRSIRAEWAEGRPAVPPEDPREIERLLTDRAQRAQEGVRRFHEERQAALVRESLSAEHSYAVLHAHARLIDAAQRFVYDWALEEAPLLVAIRRRDLEGELALARTQIAQKEEKLAQFRAQLPAILANADPAPHAKSYYARIETSMARECQELRARVEELEGKLPALRGMRAEPALFAKRIVVFARGGYGRGELSFESDLDTGYCIDARGLPPGAQELLRELIVRMETLLHGAGLHTAHQYFEIDEDLSRFAEPQAQHTILSVLESRPLAGNGELLRKLQHRFRALLPFEQLAMRKVEEYEALRPPTSTEMNLKEDFGGLRSIQIPLWLIGLTYRAETFGTPELLALAWNKGMLSLRDAARLAQASELLFDLRNFLGAEDKGEGRKAAPEAALGPRQRSRVLDEAVRRRYLRAKRRFASRHALERWRLRLLADVQRITRSLMGRVLDRTVTHPSGQFRITVHLSTKRITALQPALVGLDLTALLERTSNLLELFSYIAETGYDPTDALKDTLAELVSRVAPATTPSERSQQAAALNRILLAPSAHRAVATLFEISDPLTAECETLISRFIPACERLFYRVPETERGAMPAHECAVRSLANGQRRLVWLREAYPEWAPLLEQVHVQGLKWSLLLHGLGQAEPVPAPDARSAELAAEALAALGIQDEGLEQLVRLLVQHQQALVRLTRTAPYIDQALAEYFELAERDVVKAILLFLVNLAILEARDETPGPEAEHLLRFFDEAMKILAELRAIPTTDRSLELINVYLDNKKRETEADTRLHVLLNRSLAQGLDAAVYLPLQRLGGPDWKRLARETPKLDSLHQQIILGRGAGPEQERLVSRLFQSLRHHVGVDSLHALTGEEVIGWFFTAFPNRYLLRTPPAQLARQMVKFADFRSAPVRVDVLTGAHGSVEGLLIAVRELRRPHTRVAYALGLRRINILSGKVNRVDFGDGEQGYCYYFEVSSLLPGQELHSRDLEALILEESAAELALPREWFSAARQATRLRFLGDDGKGYEVARERGAFLRRATAYEQLRIIRRDEPFLFHRLCRAFDSFHVEWRQALITTTGNLVVDDFSLLPADLERLRQAEFQRQLIALMDAHAPAEERASGT